MRTLWIRRLDEIMEFYLDNYFSCWNFHSNEIEKEDIFIGSVVKLTKFDCIPKTIHLWWNGTTRKSWENESNFVFAIFSLIYKIFTYSKTCLSSGNNCDMRINNMEISLNTKAYVIWFAWYKRQEIERKMNWNRTLIQIALFYLPAKHWG